MHCPGVWTHCTGGWWVGGGVGALKCGCMGGRCMYCGAPPWPSGQALGSAQETSSRLFSQKQGSCAARSLNPDTVSRPPPAATARMALHCTAPQVESLARVDCALAELTLMDQHARTGLKNLAQSRNHLTSAVQLRLVSVCLGCAQRRAGC